MEASMATAVQGDKSKAADDLHVLPLMLQHRKRPTPINVLKAVVCMLRLRSSHKSKSEPKSVPKFFWKSLVASMRPMHFERKSGAMPMPIGQNIEEVHTPPVSPTVDTSTSPVFSVSSQGSMSDLSQYESPLVEIRPSEETGEGDEFWYDDDEGDEMIDIKAEEFIAQFYHQIRLQNLNS